MFDRLKSKFHSVQENITSSIRGLSTTDQLGRSQVSGEIQEINIDAGTSLIDSYQTCWAELHSSAQENAIKAQEVDNLIGKLHKRLKKQALDIGHTGTILAKLPEVIHSVNEIMERITSLEELFDAVEKSLIQFEDLVETRELQDRQLDHRFQLTLYKEKKLSMLENFRVSMAEKHAENIRRHELRQQRLMKERQETFERQFRNDMELYKETNTISKINSKSTNNGTDCTLEEVKLDSEDCSSLDDFLKDSISDPS